VSEGSEGRKGLGLGLGKGGRKGEESEVVTGGVEREGGEAD